MAKERLSKLQKWILAETYKNIGPETPNGILARWQIIRGYFSNRTPSKEVIVSRSVWSLIEKKYITGLTPRKVEDITIIYGKTGISLKNFKDDYKDFMEKQKEKIASVAIKGFDKVKIIILTEKGKEKAKKLLMLNSEKK